MRTFVLLPTWVLFLILGIIPFAIPQIDHLCFSNSVLSDSVYREWLLVLPMSLLQVIWLGSLNNELSKALERKTGMLRSYRVEILLVLFSTGILIQSFVPGLEAYVVFFTLSIVITTLSYLGILVLLTRNLRNLEDLDANFGKQEVWRDFIQFACYPLGIWFLHPRIRRVLTNN